MFLALHVLFTNVDQEYKTLKENKTISSIYWYQLFDKNYKTFLNNLSVKPYWKKL